MKYKLLLHTVRYLRPHQVCYQLWYKVHKPKYKAKVAPDGERGRLRTEPIPRFASLKGNRFTFLNLGNEFAGWNFTDKGMLWAYNQNYFDWLNQPGMTAIEGCKWIDKFIEELPSNRIGLHPYPIALRCINWVKFFCKYPGCATKERLDSLYSQLCLLEKKLEYQVLGNHLLEDAYGLYIGAYYLGDTKMLSQAVKLLQKQLEEQVLTDGAHYEQSPMYHCILLDRLLDCINISGLTNSTDYTNILSSFAERMLGHLESIVWNDGSIPLLNDSANNIAPMPKEIFEYAYSLGLKWQAIPMKVCGYRRMMSERMEVTVDVGNIMASYQPGHAHADTFNYELRIDGKPFVVDTGISTYNKNERRQLERSSKAHNCVVVDGKDSSEVWGGFRVGKRCHTDIIEDTDKTIVASHDGFGKPCKRRFEMTEETFVVEDWYEGEAVSYVHLAENADSDRIKVKGTKDIEVKPWKYSTEYNRFHNGRVMEIRFNNHIRIQIS